MTVGVVTPGFTRSEARRTTLPPTYPYPAAPRYDPLQNSWSTMPPMTTPRSGHAMAALGGKIFAIGGYDGEDRLSSVEFFSPWTGKWTLGEELTIKRVCAASPRD